MQRQEATITQPSTIFGLRYLEEESAEINDITGCFEVEQPIDGGGGGGGGGYTPTHYTTNCDYSDTD